jgi:glutathione S-transferase
MQLISLPVSPFAARVRIAIYAKELNVPLVPPPAGWPKASRRSVGPIGRVPVLICDDGVIPESQVILEYLEERFPDARRLLPQTAKERAHTRLLSRVVDLYLMPPIVSLASPGSNDEQRRSHVQAVLDALHIVDDLVGASLYAAGKDLSLADCALAPALFAAWVTGERHGFNVLVEHKNLKRYVATIEQHKDVGRVLREMAEGLRRMGETSST